MTRDHQQIHVDGRCSELGCARGLVARGLCGKHYQVRRKAGSLPTWPLPRPSVREAALASFTPEPTSGCWLWTGPLNSYGYGAIWRHERGATTTFRAHRVVYEALRGPIPPGLWALHRCDNRACVNPDHIFLGTHVDNMADMRAKGRGALGERNASTRLSAAELTDVRAALSAGEGHGVIARRFSVSRSLVSMIAAGKRRAAGREAA